MFKETTNFLIVDDFSTSRKIVKNALIEIGYTNSLEAADGVEAFQVLTDAAKTANPVEFIISDWNMPNMLGIDFLRKCRAEPAFKSLPFILITVESEPTQILEAGSAGVTDFIVKPFTVDALRLKLTAAYNKINGTRLREAK